MTFATIIGIIVLALLIAVIFYYGLKSRGPWGSFWTFFLVVFFGIWIAALWVTPAGPVYWGMAWLDLIFVGILFALILAAASPLSKKDFEDPEAKVTTERYSRTGAVVGAFFWIMLLFFILAVIARFIV